MRGQTLHSGDTITVRRVLENLSTYGNSEEIFRDYPYLIEEDLKQALRFAAVAVDDEIRDFHRVA